jgi:hypothetical protein
MDKPSEQHFPTTRSDLERMKSIQPSRPEILSAEEICANCVWSCPECKQGDGAAICPFDDREDGAKRQFSHDIQFYETLIPKLVDEAKRKLLIEIEEHISYPPCYDAGCDKDTDDSDSCPCFHVWWQEFKKSHGIGE